MVERTQRFLDSFVIIYKWLQQEGYDHYAAATGNYVTVGEKRSALHTIGIYTKESGRLVYIYFNAAFDRSNRKTYFSSLTLFDWEDETIIHKHRVDDAMVDTKTFLENIKEVLND